MNHSLRSKLNIIIYSFLFQVLKQLQRSSKEKFQSLICMNSLLINLLCKLGKSFMAGCSEHETISIKLQNKFKAICLKLMSILDNYTHYFDIINKNDYIKELNFGWILGRQYHYLNYYLTFFNLSLNYSFFNWNKLNIRYYYPFYFPNLKALFVLRIIV